MCSWFSSCMPLGAFLARVGQARPPRIPPPRPADASRPASIAGGAAELALVCDEGQGTLPGSGEARCARCARRDRMGAPWGRATPLRQPSPPRRGFASMCAPDPNPDPNPNRRLPCGDHRCAALHGGVGGVRPVSILRLLGRYSYGSGRDHVCRSGPGLPDGVVSNRSVSNSQAESHRGWGWGGRLTQKASPGRHAHAPRHPNRPPLNPALSGRLADGCPLVPPPIFRCLLFYEKSRGNSV